MRFVIWAAVAVGICACNIDLGDVRDPLGDDPDAVSWDDAAVDPVAPADEAAPEVTIDTTEEVDPPEGEPGAFLRLTGTSADDRAVTAIEVMVGASGPYRVEVEGVGFAAWQAIVPAPPVGPVPLVATAYDAGGNTGRAERVHEREMPADGTDPVLVISAPVDGAETNVRRLFVEGTAADDTAVVDVQLSMEVDEMPEVPLGRALTADHFAHWSLQVDLPPAAEVVYIARATDLGGNVTEARSRVISRAAPLHDPPRLVRSTPADGAALDSAFVSLSLTLEADVPLVGVHAGVDGGPLLAADFQPGDGTYDVALRLRPGANRVRVVARDADGLVGFAEIALTLEDGWGDGPIIGLEVPSEPGGEVQLDLDKQGVLDMFPVAVQEDTVLLELDPRPLVRAALGIIRDACGPGWDGPHFAEGAFLFDCPPEWGAPERNLWGLLTMTPANVDVSGTILAPFPQLARDNLLLGPDGQRAFFNDILATALQIAPNQLMLGDDPLVEAIVEALFAPHAETTATGEMPVTLRDGLLDMAPLEGRFGSDGTHPGFIAGPVQAEVLTADFGMQLSLISNLRLYQGLAFAPPGAPPRPARKTWFADREPAVPVVDLEFLDPARFDLQGIAPAPEVAMYFQMVESAREAVPGTGLEPIGTGDSDVWDPAAFRPWELEHVVALASRIAFGPLRTGCDRCVGGDAGAAIWTSGVTGNDFAEVTIGRTGYDCAPAGRPEAAQCTAADPTEPGITEHMERLVRADCDGDNNLCRREFGADFICLDNACVDVSEVQCLFDGACPGGQRCFAGQCRPADEVACNDNADCAADTVCHRGACMPVPAGWFRLWMVEAAQLPDPAYMWDVVLQVAQARLRDGGVPEGGGTALFQLEGVPVGLTAAEIEAQVRESLQAQRLTLADALLGAYTDPTQRVDLYLDTLPDGSHWLMISPCQLGIAFPNPMQFPCQPNPAVGLFDPAGAALSGPAPNGMAGMRLDALDPQQTLYYVDADGVRHRMDVIAVDPEAGTLKLWMRTP